MPALTRVEIVALLLALTMLNVCLLAWGWTARRVTRRQPLLELEARHAVPWGAIDLMLLSALALVIQFALFVVVQQWYPEGIEGGMASLPASELSLLIAASAAATALILVADLIYLTVFVRATKEDLGLSLGRFGRDVVAGATAFVLLIVPVLALQLVLKQLFPESGDHPLVTMVLDDPQPGVILLAILAAVVVAPIAEEFFFRVFLQGWLEAIPQYRHQFARLLLGRWADVLAPSATATDPVATAASQTPNAANSFAAEVLPEAGEASPAGGGPPSAGLAGEADPYQAPQAFEPNGADGAPPTNPTRVPVWPVFVSSLIFAAFHIGHGPDPIPLFFLALGLGYLYRQTHRALPCIVLHMLVNATAMLLLGLTLLGR